MIAPALSVGWFVDRLMHGPKQPAIGLGHGHLKVSTYVVTLTPPGGPRMPNGIECTITAAAGEELLIGDGALTKDGTVVTPGPVWDAVPRVQATLDANGARLLDPNSLLGRGIGLTPQGDDVLVGYVAGSALFRHEWTDLRTFLTAEMTTSLSSTLLFHACLGELPQPAHALLGSGDPDPLLAFGHSSGQGILLGLALSCPHRVHGDPPSRVLVLHDVAGLPEAVIRIYRNEPSRLTI
jgi:hypothetical protein